jgi:hydroxymethylpyrimidine pyrophosphatase-like HAD family hydrolase
MSGTSPEQVMAFGDDQNDLSMIEVCVGVAVENAISAVKEAAHYVTEFDHDHDGVAEFVETHVLNA